MSSDNMHDATGLVFLGGLGNSGYPHMLIPTNPTLLTILLDCTCCNAQLMYMQCDNAKADIPMLVSCVKCNQSDQFADILMSETKVLVPGL